MTRKAKRLITSSLLFLFLAFITKISYANAESNYSGPILDLFWITVAGSVVVGGLVFGLTIYFLVKYNEKSDTKRKRVVNEGKYEKIWVSFAIILVFILVVISTPVLYSIAYPAQSTTQGAVVIDVQAQRWSWNVAIPSENITKKGMTDPTTDTIPLKVGQEYELNITSIDVAHSFFVYDLAIKVDAIPGQMNTRFFKITDPGTYIVTCAEYCGVNHYTMQFALVAT